MLQRSNFLFVVVCTNSILGIKQCFLFVFPQNISAGRAWHFIQTICWHLHVALYLEVLGDEIKWHMKWLWESTAASDYERLIGVYIAAHCCRRRHPRGSAENLPDQRLLTFSNKHAKWAGGELKRMELKLFSKIQESAGQKREEAVDAEELTENSPPPFLDHQWAFIIRAFRFFCFFAKQELVAENENRQLLLRIQLQFLVLHLSLLVPKCYCNLIQPTLWFFGGDFFFFRYRLWKSKFPAETVWSNFKICSSANLVSNL